MANKPIQSTDIASADVFTKLITDTKALIANMEMLDKSTSDYAKNVQKLSKGFSANQAGDVQQAIQTQKQLTAEIVEQEKRERAKIQTKKTLISLEKMQASSARQQAKEQELLTNAYKRESKQLNDLRNAYKNLAAAEKANTKEAKAMLVQITKLDTKLKGIDQTVGQSQRNVGNYGSAFGKLGNAVGNIGARFLGLTAILYGVGRVLTSSVGIFSNFEQENANLAAVLGKTRSEITALTEDAKRLGSTTKFTASEVTRMQVAFSKLGFNEQEIINATEATLALAAATGTELDEAAEVSAATLNGFGLEASETQRVVDVMAKSFTTSALDMEKFKVAMRAVGPIARTAGFSIERTTAMLGVLADNGVRAETAGTGLRNVFLELSKRGITFEQAMSKIANSSDKAATSMELFGKENAVVGVVLSENNDKLVEMEDGLNNAGGAAKEMADTQLDTLQGSVTKLSSAWEGFILSLEDGNGVISRVFKGAIDMATELVNTLTLLNASNTLQAYQNQLNAATSTNFEDIAQSGIKNIKEQLKLSTDVLKTKEKESELAARILELRDKQITGEEAFLILSTENFVKTQAQLDKANKAKQDDYDKQIARQQQINKLTGIKDGKFTVEADRVLEYDIAAAEGLKKVRKENLDLSVKQKSNDEILALLANEQLFKTSEYGSVLKSILNAELQRRKDIKEIIIETNEEIDKGTKSEKKSAYDLAKAEDNQITKAERRTSSIDSGSSDVARGNKTNAEIYQEEADRLQAIEDARVQAQKDLARDLTNITIMLIDKRIEALDREAEAQQRNYDEAKQREQEIIELRKAGAVNTAESLAFEREAQAKALKEQEKIAKKKQRLELTNSAINMFNSAVQNGNGNPLGKTMADVSALVGFIRTLPAFWSGTDTTVGDSLGTQISSGRDGILARVDKSEMILNKGKVDKLAGYGITTTDGILEAIEGKRFVATSTSNRAIVLDNSEVVAKLDKQEKLLQQIASRPHESTDIEKISNAILITQQLTQGNKVTKTTKVIRP